MITVFDFAFFLCRAAEAIDAIHLFQKLVCDKPLVKAVLGVSSVRDEADIGRRGFEHLQRS